MSAPVPPDGAPGAPAAPIIAHPDVAMELARDPTLEALLQLSREGSVVAAAEALVADLAARLRPVCTHLGDAAFSALVLDVARMKIRFATIEGRRGLPGHVVPPAGRA